MTEEKARKRANGLNNLVRGNPNLYYEVAGSGDNCIVQQVNRSANRPGEANYGVAAY
jgi:hypothetical protein